MAIDYKITQLKYSEITEIWPDSDRWHRYTHACINEFVNKHMNVMASCERLLNVGSSGFNYNIINNMHIHMDIVKKTYKTNETYIIGNAESIPIKSHSLDGIICVGSVINYCDAMRTLCEFGRVLKPGGVILLEFENSKSFEYAFKANGDISLTETIYQNEKEYLWLYSRRYIANILALNNIYIYDEQSFHIISSLACLLTRQQGLSSVLSKLDSVKFLSFPLRRYASNIAIICQKRV